MDEVKEYIYLGHQIKKILSNNLNFNKESVLTFGRLLKGQWYCVRSKFDRHNPKR